LSTAFLDKVRVEDPFNVTADSALGDMVQALRPAEMEPRLVAVLLNRDPAVRGASLREIRVVRHKVGRRCLIEYCLEIPRGNGSSEELTLIGKARANHRPETVYARQQALTAAGFGEDSADGISVPDAVACFPDLNLWLQHKVPGLPLGSLLHSQGAECLAARVAEAACKVHRCGVPTRRTHTMADEVRILRERLPAVSQMEPRWTGRIDRLLAACERLASLTPLPICTGIHRDFYQDQVIVSGERLYLIDFDLYCIGDPAVDAGNFLAHVEEQALRETGDSRAYDGFGRALVDAYLKLAGADQAASVDAYARLTLVRHIYLSTLFQERRHLTPVLLDMCESRLAAWY